MIVSQTVYSWFSFLDFWEDQLPWQPLYVVCDVEYCDLLTMATRAVEWGSIILSQDVLTKPENWVISCVAGMPHLKQLYSKSSVTARFQVRADYIVHLRICTRPSLLSIWWERGQHVYISPLDALFVRHTRETYICNQSEYVYGHILRTSCIVQSITHQCSTYQSQTIMVGAIHLAEPE